MKQQRNEILITKAKNISCPEYSIVLITNNIKQHKIMTVSKFSNSISGIASWKHSHLVHLFSRDSILNVLKYHIIPVNLNAI
jgi:hypothetical protein